jgi:hypothetical protein
VQCMQCAGARERILVSVAIAKPTTISPLVWNGDSYWQLTCQLTVVGGQNSHCRSAVLVLACRVEHRASCFASQFCRNKRALPHCGIPARTR